MNSRSPRLRSLTWRAAVLACVFTTMSACQPKSPPTASSVESNAQSQVNVPVQADIDLASGDESKILDACIRVFGLHSMLMRGRDDWPGTAVEDTPWFTSAIRADHADDIQGLLAWTFGGTREEFDKLLGSLEKEFWLVAMRENGWASATTSSPFELTPTSWEALERRLVLCGSLSRRRASREQPVQTESPRGTQDLGYPPMIVEVQPE